MSKEFERGYTEALKDSIRNKSKQVKPKFEIEKTLVLSTEYISQADDNSYGPFEIEKTLVLSTGHITEEDDNKLKNHYQLNGGMAGELGLCLDKHEYGHIIYLTEFTITKQLRKEFSEGFIKSLELGIKLGVNYVKFDCDANLIDELPKNEW